MLMEEVLELATVYKVSKLMQAQSMQPEQATAKVNHLKTTAR